MANKFRGEVDFEVGERKFTLCCTLHALAEIQTELGVDGLSGIYKRMLELNIRDYRTMLLSLMRGGGHEITDEEFAQLPLDALDSIRIVGEAFLAANLLGNWPGREPDSTSDEGSGDPIGTNIEPSESNDGKSA